MFDHLYVKRSPGRIAWWVMMGGKRVDVCNTRQEAIAVKDEMVKIANRIGGGV